MQKEYIIGCSSLFRKRCVVIIFFYFLIAPVITGCVLTFVNILVWIECFLSDCKSLITVIAARIGYFSRQLICSQPIFIYFKISVTIVCPYHIVSQIACMRSRPLFVHPDMVFLL